MKVCVIGLGYVGSVAAAGLAASNHDVIAIDQDLNKVEMFRRGEVPFYEKDLAELITTGCETGHLHFFHPNEVTGYLGDVIVVATGTPTNINGEVDSTQIQSALSWIKEKQPQGGVVVMKSTVPPGKGIQLAETALKDCSTFEYVSNPEFLQEGRAVLDWFNPDRIVVGTQSEHGVEVLKALYSDIDAPILFTDITSAELIKYASNAFLATKISFINEIARLSDSIGADIDDVAIGVGLESRIGPKFLQSGVGYGGSCLPKDVGALTNLALDNGLDFALLRSVIEVNKRQRLLPIKALRDKFGDLSGITVGILGLTFKPDTDDLREAPAVDLVCELADAGVAVRVFDPMILDSKKLDLPSAVEIVTDIAECARGAEALVLMTEWPEIVTADWARLLKETREPHLFFDGRNALNPEAMAEMGFDYLSIGRLARVADQGNSTSESPKEIQDTPVSSSVK